MKRLLCAAVLVACCAPAQAATLRSLTTLHVQVVRLKDLFDDAGRNADRVLGPGPAPGARIVVEARQLAAIAREFDVNWRPISSGDRAVLDRPGRPLDRELALGALRQALASAGASDDCRIELAAFTAPIVPADAAVTPAVSQMDFDPASGRFTAVLTLTGPSITPIDTRVSGRAEAVVEVPVAAQRLLPGTVLVAEDVRMAKLPADQLQGRVARTIADVVGLQLRHQAAPGRPLQMAELDHPALVRKDAAVLLLLDSPGIALTAAGHALQSGGMGDRVRVLNPISKAVVEGEVIGEGRVRVDPSSLPLVPAGGAARQDATEFGR